MREKYVWREGSLRRRQSKFHPAVVTQVANILDATAQIVVRLSRLLDTLGKTSLLRPLQGEVLVTGGRILIYARTRSLVALLLLGLRTRFAHLSEA